MFFLSSLRRLYRRMFSKDFYPRLGKPKPIGARGREAGIWIAFNASGLLREQDRAAYLVCGGPSMLEPIAICWGIGPNLELTRADFRAAKSIANNWDLAGAKTGNPFDLRGCNHLDPRYECLLDLVLPTDRKGRPVANSGALTYLPEGGAIHAFDVIDIIWEITHRSGRPVPRFDMNIDGDWQPVPGGLKEYLDQIDPLPPRHQQKNSGQIAVGTLSPGQLESNESAGLTAA